MVRLFVATALAIVLASPSMAQGGKGGGNTVSVTGCPTQGTANCLVIKGQDGSSYDISSAKPRPKPNYLVIRLTGRKTDRVSMCNAGTVLDQIKWSYTRQKCPKAQ